MFKKLPNLNKLAKSECKSNVDCIIRVLTYSS